MDQKDKIEDVLKRNLNVGEPVTEKKISEIAKNLIESVDWGDAKDSAIKKVVDWGDGKDRKP